MTRRLKPHLDILPPEQLRLWPALRPAAGLGFTLYGGTAIALRLGHRQSVDFDFFTHKPLDREAIRSAFAFVARATTLQEQRDSWVLLVPDPAPGGRHVQVSFFGGIAFGRVGNPELTDDETVLVASLEDLMATKVKVVLQRAEAKDYRDVAAMLAAGASLPHALAAARLLFGPNYQPSESLKALVYFEDGDLRTLSHAEQELLVEAVSAVRDLPAATLRSTALGSE